MLDQHADEPFHGPQRGSMDHHGTVSFVVRADVLQIKTLGTRQVVVELYRAKLPFATETVRHNEVRFRAIESSLAFLGFCFNTQFVTHTRNKAACAFSQFSSLPTYFSLPGSRKPSRTR